MEPLITLACILAAILIITSTTNTKSNNEKKIREGRKTHDARGENNMKRLRKRGF